MQFRPKVADILYNMAYHATLLLQILFRSHHVINPNWLNCVTLQVPIALWLQLNYPRENESVSPESGFTSAQPRLWPANLALFFVAAYTHFIGLHHCVQPGGFVHYFGGKTASVFQVRVQWLPNRTQNIWRKLRDFLGELPLPVNTALPFCVRGLYACFFHWFSLFCYISNKQIVPPGVWLGGIIINCAQG